MFKMKFLQMRTEKALKKNKSLRASIPYSQAKSVGILFSVEDKQKHSAVKEFIHRLEQDGKIVKVLEFLPLKKENYEFMFDFFTVKELSFWGKIDSTIADKFAATPFDYLFYLDREFNPLTLHLLATSKAHCRVGRFFEHESNYFELMIEQNGTDKGLMDSMYKYTAQLK
jgi:hypothetical protein